MDNMTASNEKILGVHSIDHFAISVPDLVVANNFYTEFGLRVVDEGDVLRLRTFHDDHDWGYVYKGERKRLHHIAFNCYEQDFEALRAQILSAGARSMEPPTLADSSGFWFRDGDGNPIQLKVGPKVMPDHKSHAEFASVGEGRRGFAVQPGEVAGRPRRLAHLLLFTPDVEGALSFYVPALGLRIADRGGDVIAFTFAPHGCDHHLVAFGHSPAPALHHVAWDMPSLDDVGLGAAHMKEVGYDKGWGVGRHVMGSNYFYYVRDPWGSFCEYTCEIDYIPANSAWDDGRFSVEELLGWGPEFPEYFLMNSEM